MALTAGGLQSGGGAAGLLLPGATGTDLTLSGNLTDTGGNVSISGAGKSLLIGAAGFSIVGGVLTFNAATNIALGQTVISVSGSGNFNVAGTGGFSLASNKFAMNNTPTVVAGAGAAVSNSNGTIAFTINLGGAAQTGTITLPTAATGWVVYMQDITTPASFVFRQTGGNTTTATFTCYSATTGLAINWTANDVIACIAMAY